MIRFTPGKTGTRGSREGEGGITLDVGYDVQVCSLNFIGESKTIALVSDGCSYTDDNDICLLVIIGTRPRDSNTEHEIHHKSYHYLNNYTCCIKLGQSRFCHTRTGNILHV
jgi:hypothetical protein